MRYFILTITTLILTSCAVNKAQMATQAGLNIMSHGVDVIDGIAKERITSEGESNLAIAFEAVTDLNNERAICLEIGGEGIDCGDEINGLEFYNDMMSDWNNLVTGLETARAVLVLGQESLDIWVSTGNIDQDNWGGFCRNVEGALIAIVDLLRVVNVDVPDQLTESVRYSRIVCGVVANIVRGD
jgi:hypothetical protein